MNTNFVNMSCQSVISNISCLQSFVIIRGEHIHERSFSDSK